MKKNVLCFVITILLVVIFSACSSTGSNNESASSRTVSQAPSESLSVASSMPASAVISSASQVSSSDTSTTLPKPEDDPLYAKAYGFYASNNYDEAVSISESALVQNSKAYWAYNIKGIALYFANGNSYADKSLALINKSLDINPNYSYAYFNEALIYKGLKNYDKSLTCFNKVLALKPDDVWSYFGMATVYADIKETANALDYLKKAIDLDPAVKQTARTESHFEYLHDNQSFKALVK
jgi:tetratricopeptide (TPR) repeat protein